MKESQVYINPAEYNIDLKGKNLELLEIKSQYDERIRFQYNYMTGKLILFSNIEGGYYKFKYEGELYSNYFLKQERLQKLNNLNGHI